ncbi:hypothetical protein Tco_0087720 [Tanacetum coccineum]
MGAATHLCSADEPLINDGCGWDHLISSISGQESMKQCTFSEFRWHEIDDSLYMRAPLTLHPLLTYTPWHCNCLLDSGGRVFKHTRAFPSGTRGAWEVESVTVSESDGSVSDNNPRLDRDRHLGHWTLPSDLDFQSIFTIFAFQSDFLSRYYLELS